MSVQIVYARKCSHCSKGMDEGYVVGGGEEYYCSNDCLWEHYTVDEWKEMSDEDDSDNYWTEWDDPTDIQYVLVDNQLKPLN